MLYQYHFDAYPNNFYSAIPGDDAEVVVWNLSTGEKMQVISCPYFGAVASIIWFPATPSSSHGFAFGCADGSIHIYMRDDTTVCRRPFSMFVERLMLSYSRNMCILFRITCMKVLSWTLSLTRTSAGLPVSVVILANHTLRLWK